MENYHTKITSTQQLFMTDDCYKQLKYIYLHNIYTSLEALLKRNKFV